MFMKNNFLIYVKQSFIAVAIIVFGLSSCKKDDTVNPGEASIISLSVGDIKATIDENGKTITSTLR